MDVALVEGVPEADILKVKQEEITAKTVQYYKDTWLAAGYVPADYPWGERPFAENDF